MRPLLRHAWLVILPVLAFTETVAAEPALAKSDVAIRVSEHRMQVGRSVVVTAVGGNDAAGGYAEVCVQQESRGSWRDLRCSAAVGDDDAGLPTVTVRTSLKRPGMLRLRARLFQTDSQGGHRLAEQASPVVAIVFYRRVGHLL